MKAVIVIYAPALECYVMGALKSSGQEKYTKMPYLHGVGGTSEPHLDTNIWPGSNSALFIATDEMTSKKLLADISKIKKQYPEQGIKAFVLPMEEAV